jgi:hypothetical protein
MTTWFPAAYLALSLIILIWDVVLAGRIAQLTQASRPFAAVTGMAGLLLLPAVLVRIATSTFITGRAVVGVDWIWPLVVVLIAIQATYAISRRLVNPLWGVPIVVYDVVLAIVEIIRIGVAHGSSIANALAGLLAAQSSTLASIIFSPIAVTTPFFLLIPMISPAFPALRRTTAAFRAFVSTLAVVWVVLFVVLGVIQTAFPSNASLRQHASDQIHERPAGDFRVGLKVFPDIAAVPSGAVVANDLALIDSLGVRAVEVVIAPGATKLAMDSIGRILDRLDDSITVIIAIGYRGKLVPELGHAPLAEAERLKTIDYIARQIQPDILLPAEDPLGLGGRIVGKLPVETWEAYVTAAAKAVKAVNPNIRIGISVSQYGTADSLLYAWAAKAGSPVDVVGFSLFPEKAGIDDLASKFEPAADRWMKTTPPVKDHWVFAAGAYPLNEGELTQERAIWQTLSWATGHAAIKGLVVYEASDYAQARGLRAPNGRLRSAARAVRRAVRGLKESITG